MKTLPNIVGPGDRVLFYFAGHGIAQDSEQEGIPEGYILPKDARRDNTDYFISMSRLRSSLEALPCRHFLLILDCCFSGAFRWANRETRSAGRIPKKIYQERFDRYVSDPAWQVLTSSAYDQEALDGIAYKSLGISRNSNNSKNSPFATHLMDALKGRADLIPSGQPDGLITATEIYMYVRDKLEKESLQLSQTNRQTPGLFYLPKHDKGEYIFLSPEIALNLPSYDPNLNPYKGLQAYEAKDSNTFFGRDKVTEELFDFVVNRSMTIVVGASGTGKSSLVKAGVFPLFESKGYETLMMRPGDEPMQTLKPLIEHNKPVEQRGFLLLIDQFEELITQCHDEIERKEFLETIAKIPEQPGQFKLIITVRSDFEPHFEEGILKPYWRDARFSVPAITPSELREIVERPAIQRVILFDPPALVDQIIEDVQHATGVLPLLSFTMSELYEKLKERGQFGAFKQEDYEALGGVIGSLSKRADELFYSLEEAHQKTMQRVMLRMVSLEGGELAKRSVLMSELEYAEERENKSVTNLLNKLTTARLIVREQNSQGQALVEPAHDALVRAWGTLWNWITAIGNDKLLLLAKLRDAAHDYQRSQNKRDLWHDNPRLEAILDEKHRMNALEEDFVHKSMQLKRRNRRRLIASLSTVIVVLSGLLIWAIFENGRANTNLKRANQKTEEAEDNLELAKSNEQEAQRQRDTAQFNALQAQLQADTANMERDRARFEARRATAQALAAQSSFALQNNQYNRSFWMAADSWQLMSIREGHKAILNTVYNSYFNYDGGIYSLPFYRNLLVEKTIYFAGFLQNSGNIYAGTGQGILILDKTGKEIDHLFASQNIVGADFSPDETKAVIILGGSSTNAAIADLLTKSLIPLAGIQTKVTSVEFSPRYSEVLIGDETGKIFLFNLEGELIRTFHNHKGKINDLQFFENGKYFLSAADDNLSRFWKTSDEQSRVSLEIIKEFNFTTQSVNCVQINKQVERFAITTNGGASDMVFFFDFNGNMTGQRKIHDAQINAIDFSPNNNYLVSASVDQSIKLFKLNPLLLNGEGFLVELFTLNGHEDMVESVSFSPDGDHLLSYSRDNTLKIWDLKSWRQDAYLVLLKNGDYQKETPSINDAEFSSDGSLMAYVYDNHFLELRNRDNEILSDLQWRVSNTAEVNIMDFKNKLDYYQFLKDSLPYYKDQGGVRLAFSPNDRYLVATSYDAHAVLLDVLNEKTYRISGSKNFVAGVGTNNKGQLLLGYDDFQNNKGFFEVLDKQGNKLFSKTLDVPLANVDFVVQDNGDVVLASRNQVFYLNADWSRSKKLYQLPADAEITAIDFHPVSKDLAIGFNNFPDGTFQQRFSHQGGVVHIVDKNGRLKTKISAHNRVIKKIRFSPKGDYLFTGDFGGSAKLFTLDGFELVELVRTTNQTADPGPIIGGGFVDKEEFKILTIQNFTGLGSLHKNVVFWDLNPYRLIEKAKQINISEPVSKN